MTVSTSELTVHCRDVEEAYVRVDHRSYGSIVRLILDGTTTVRIFLDNREDFNKLFNNLNWEINEEDVDEQDEASV